MTFFCYISGIKDFVPEIVQGGYEPFSNLVKKASRWINEEKAVYVTNFKSIHISRENGMLWFFKKKQTFITSYEVRFDFPHRRGRKPYILQKPMKIKKI